MGPPFLQEPPASRFISNCPTLGLRGIAAADRKCPVCLDEYVARSARPDLTVDLDTTVARRLPCKHVFCSQCIANWFTPITETPKSTCPLCRKEFFPRMPPVNTTEGLQAKSDLVDWMIVDQRITLTPEENEMAAILKNHLLSEYIMDATTEFEEAMQASRPYTRLRELGWTWLKHTQILVRDTERPVMQELAMRRGIIQLMKLELFKKIHPVEQRCISAHYQREIRALLDCLTEIGRLRGKRNIFGDSIGGKMLSNAESSDDKQV